MLILENINQAGIAFHQGRSKIYDAREHALDMLRKEADAIGADEVVGIKTHIHELGNLIEFMAIGTAVALAGVLIIAMRRNQVWPLLLAIRDRAQ